MAKVPQYTQDRLASSITPVVVDNSAAVLTGQISKDVDAVAQTSFELAAKKQREVDAQLAKVKSVNDTLTAYDKSISVENEMYDIIEEEKNNNITNPQLAVKNIEARGRELIAIRMSELNGTADIAVKEKMAGIITNSFRGKLSELHSWQLAQDTANAQSKVGNVLHGLSTRASRATNINDVLGLLNFEQTQDGSGVSLGDAIQIAHGSKGLKEIEKGKKDIAKSYLIGMLDRKNPNQVGATLDSGVFDNILDPDEKLQIKKMAKTMSNAEASAARRDAWFEIYSIKENAIILSAEGKYTPSQALSDKKRIQSLGGKSTDLMVITNKSLSSDKVSDKQSFESNQRNAHDKVTKEWARISGKSGNLKADTELEDVINFQNLVEQNRDYFTPEKYDMYMVKLSKGRMKRVKDMRTDWLGNPQGVLKGDDETSKGYTQIYKYANQNYKGDDKKRLGAMDNMVGDFVKMADRMEAQSGKPLTEGQRQSIVKTVTNREAQRSNPHLQDIPKEGALRKDPKTGRVYRIYPDGRSEIVK